MYATVLGSAGRAGAAHPVRRRLIPAQTHPVQKQERQGDGGVYQETGEYGQGVHPQVRKGPDPGGGHHLGHQAEGGEQTDVGAVLDRIAEMARHFGLGFFEFRPNLRLRHLSARRHNGQFVVAGIDRDEYVALFKETAVGK